MLILAIGWTSCDLFAMVVMLASHLLVFVKYGGILWNTLAVGNGTTAVSAADLQQFPVSLRCCRRRLSPTEAVTPLPIFPTSSAAHGAAHLGVIFCLFLMGCVGILARCDVVLDAAK